MVKNTERQKKKYQEVLNIIKHINPDDKYDESSRKKVCEFFQQGGFNDISPYDFEGCHYLNFNRYQLESTRGITLFPLCIVAPYKKLELIKTKINAPYFAGGGFCIYFPALDFSIFFLNNRVEEEDVKIHEAIHLLFSIINTMEKVHGEKADRYFINEMLALHLGGRSFERIDTTFDSYMDNYLTELNLPKENNQKYVKLIREKLIPVAKYLDKTYPRQFFDILSRTRSIDELWDAFGDKAEAFRKKDQEQEILEKVNKQIEFHEKQLALIMKKPPESRNLDTQMFHEKSLKELRKEHPKDLTETEETVGLVTEEQKREEEIQEAIKLQEEQEMLEKVNERIAFLEEELKLIMEEPPESRNIDAQMFHEESLKTLYEYVKKSGS
ncbi:MAG: hypothetical protein KAU95_02195 [Candidatus Aenigmarchaeota archaeon]|nr:hypothetical protein [Candidatus Aenigmarchaeota archaeon]